MRKARFKSPRDETAARLAAIVESSDDAIVSKTLQGVITTWNPAAERMFGYSEAEVVGRPITLIIPEERWSEEEYVLSRIARGEAVRHFETVRVARDGRRIDISLTVSPVRNAAGEIVGASKIARDITERRRLEEAARIGQEWFSTALHSIGDAVITTDPRGAVTLLNPVAERLAGWRDEEARGRPLREVFPIFDETTRAAVESPVELVIREGSVVGLATHTILVRRDGSEIAIDDSAAPIRSHDGSLAGVVLVFRDVTRKRREEARVGFLARATEALASSLDYEATMVRLVGLAVPDIADWASVDLVDEGRIKRLAVAHVDPAGVALVEELDRRYPPDADATFGTSNIVRTGRPELLPDILPEVLAARARNPEHLALIQKLAPHSYIGVPLRSRNRTIGVLTFVAAGSKRRYGDDDLALAVALADRAVIAIENARLYRAAEEARASAETATRSKDEFLAMLGHELRNPLAPIATAVALMKMRGGSVFERERGVIERQLTHVTNLVDDLLDVSRITRGKVELSLEPVEVADAVARAIETVSSLLEQRRHRLSVAVPPGLVVRADSKRLAQVINNLLNNAAKYTEPGGHIEVGAERVGGEVELWVADDGMGIAPELLPRVFDTFVQGGQMIDRAHGGLGIGLTIVKSLVGLHGGSVWAESEGLCKGSRFRVRLPAAEGGLHAESCEVESVATLPSERQRKARILVVDDNADAAELLGEVLGDFGYEVMVAHDGPTALALATREGPALALLNIGLPVMDGYELATRLRALKGLEQVRLIAVTGYGQDSDRRRSSEAGFDAHLIKPVQYEELQATVEQLIKP